MQSRNSADMRNCLGPGPWDPLGPCLADGASGGLFTQINKKIINKRDKPEAVWTENVRKLSGKFDGTSWKDLKSDGMFYFCNVPELYRRFYAKNNLETRGTFYGKKVLECESSLYQTRTALHYNNLLNLCGNSVVRGSGGAGVLYNPPATSGVSGRINLIVQGVRPGCSVMTACLSDTIGDVMRVISMATGIRMQHMRLLCRGKDLTNRLEETLLSCQISNNSVLSAIPRMRGGMPKVIFPENLLDGYCPGCDAEFDEETVVPRILPCSHSMCSGCIRKNIRLNSSVTCPIDAQTFPLQLKDLALLRKGFKEMTGIQTLAEEPQIEEQREGADVNNSRGLDKPCEPTVEAAPNVAAALKDIYERLDAHERTLNICFARPDVQYELERMSQVLSGQLMEFVRGVLGEIDANAARVVQQEVERHVSRLEEGITRILQQHREECILSTERKTKEVLDSAWVTVKNAWEYIDSRVEEGKRLAEFIHMKAEGLHKTFTPLSRFLNEHVEEMSQSMMELERLGKRKIEELGN